jgi:hypothetical protein
MISPAMTSIALVTLKPVLPGSSKQMTTGVSPSSW